MVWYTQIPVHASFWSDLLPGYLLVGFGLPFAFIPVSIAALAGIEHHEAGLASGLLNTGQQVGGAVGVAVASSVSLSHFNHVVGKEGFAKAFTSGSQWAFWIMVGVGVVGLAGDADTGEQRGTRRPGRRAGRRDGSRVLADGPRVSDDPRPGRQHADRPARPDLARRARPHPREARVHESGRLEQGSHRARDDRGGRARREASAGRHDRGADVRQHRRGPRDRRGAEGLPVHLRDARQDEPGEDRDAARLRRGGRDHADGRRPRLARVLLLGVVAAGRGDRRRVQARPVLEHGEPGGALSDDRARRSGSRPTRARSRRSSSRSERAARSAASAGTSRSAGPR